MEAALCQPRLVRPVEYQDPWCHPTPPPPEHRSIRHRYKILASQDEAAMTYGTTPTVLIAVSQYLRSLTQQLWRMFIGAQTFLLGSFEYGTETPLLRFFASQPRWMLPYFRHIVAGSSLDSFWYKVEPHQNVRCPPKPAACQKIFKPAASRFPPHGEDVLAISELAILQLWTGDYPGKGFEQSRRNC